MVRNLPAKAGDFRNLGSVLGLARSPGGGHGNPLRSSCLEPHGQRSLAGYSPWSRRQLVPTEGTWHTGSRALVIPLSSECKLQELF